MSERDHLQRLSNVWLQNPLYFITCCTAARRPLLATPDAAAIVIAALRSSLTHHRWAVGRYVIMPDHVHFFARPQPASKTLSDFIRDWKKWTARELIRSSKASAPVWQPEFFDHLLRFADSYSEKWDYVRHNPVRAALSATPEAWPYSGECETLTF